MATITAVQAARTSLAISADTLASATYVASSEYDAAANDPLDVLIEVTGVTTNTPSGNKQLIAYAIASLDGTNYQSGPTSGTSDTDAPCLTFIGVVPMSAAGTFRKTFSLGQAFGFIPAKFKIVFKNDTGVALTAGSTIYTAEITGASN